MKIIRTQHLHPGTQHKTAATERELGTLTLQQVANKMVEMARQEALRLPNTPKIVQTGPLQISIQFCQYTHASYDIVTT